MAHRAPTDVSVYINHALVKASHLARAYSQNPGLPKEAVEAYRWAEREFDRLARKQVGEQDLIG